MTGTRLIERERLDQVFLDSVAQKRPVVLTHHGPQGWQTIKSTFIGGSPASNSLRVRGNITMDNTANLIPIIGSTLGGSFRLGHKKCLFCGVVQSVQRYREHIELVIRWPEHLQQLQRRAYERATPPEGTIIAVKFWREDDQQTGSEPRNPRHGQLEDISAGGMRIKIAEPKDVDLNCTYRCAFTSRPGRPALVLDALLRHCQQIENGRASLGFQFVGLETTPDGLKTLDRIASLVSQFQRQRPRDTNTSD